jgi:hypothetical protein
MIIKNKQENVQEQNKKKQALAKHRTHYSGAETFFWSTTQIAGFLLTSTWSSFGETNAFDMKL